MGGCCGAAERTPDTIAASELRDTSYLISLLLLFMSPLAARARSIVDAQKVAGLSRGRRFQEAIGLIRFIARANFLVSTGACIVAAFVAHSRCQQKFCPDKKRFN